MDATTHPDDLIEHTGGSGHRAGILSILWFWAFCFGINTIRMALAGADHQFAMAGRRLITTLVGICLTFCLALLLRRLARARLAVRLGVAFATALPVSVAYAAFNHFAFYIYAPMQFFPDEAGPAAAHHIQALLTIVSMSIDWYFFIVAWSALYIALSSAAEARDAERQAERYRAQAQSAQLRALRYQLNPHFLFNTLNSLSTLVLRRTPDDAEKMIFTLSAFLRATLATDPTEDTTLADEIKVQRLYLDIEQVRFPDRLRVAIDIPPELETARIPALLLQPLVENAIKYGVARTMRPVTITIRARADRGTLHLSVSDDGAETAPAEAGHGVGLRNVAARLQTRFGPGATFQAGPCQEGGYCVDLRMKLQHAGLAPA